LPEHAGEEVVFASAACFHGHVLHTCDRLDVALDKADVVVVDAVLLAELFD